MIPLTPEQYHAAMFVFFQVGVFGTMVTLFSLPDEQTDEG